MKFPHGIIIKVMPYSGIGFDPDYLVEDSELKQHADRVRARKAGIDPKPKATPGDGLDYITKEEIGEMHAAGFIRTMSSKNSKGFDHFESLSKDERRRRVIKSWRAHSRKFPKTMKDHHRLVFSMSKEFHDALVKKGVNPQTVLHQCMKRSMRNFTDQFHKGDSLGYVYGFHHDTDNLHAHVFVHPRTQKGKFTSFSSQLKGRTADGRMDKLNFLKKSMETQLRFWEKRLEDPELRKTMQKHARGHQFTFTPRPRIPRNPTVQPGVPQYKDWVETKTRLVKAHQELKSMESEIRSLRKERANIKMGRNGIRLIGYRPSAMEKAVAKMAQEIALSMIREKQAQRFKLQQTYRREMIKAQSYRFPFSVNPIVHQQIRRKYEHRTSPAGDITNKATINPQFKPDTNGIRNRFKSR
jgi:hypothetical protein